MTAHKPVDAQGVLRKIRGLIVTSWNYVGRTPKEFWHYGPVAQDFFAVFGDDGVGTIGSPTCRPQILTAFSLWRSRLWVRKARN